MRKQIFIWILLLLFSINFSFGQTKKVTGNVTDEKGKILSGATIEIKNTKLKTLSNDKGNYSIDVPTNATTIVASYIGMQSVESRISKNLVVNFILESNINNLSDVVVIGYGSIKKGDVTGAIQRITREELIRENPTNILQAIQGKLAGVNVTQNDGAPGAGLSIRVRGSNSFLGGTEPLYVIDGVPFNNNSSGTTPESLGGDEKQTLNAMAFINPNDIESIDVLKDASATSIYGSRGANGVILITTKI